MDRGRGALDRSSSQEKARIKPKKLVRCGRSKGGGGGGRAVTNFACFLLQHFQLPPRSTRRWRRAARRRRSVQCERCFFP